MLTVDQRASRRTPDRVAGVLRSLADVPTVLRFERTAGDEFQGVLDDPAVVIAVVLDLVRAGGWSIGVGTGPVQTPLPGSTRAGAGPAFVAARAAVEAAKRRPARVAVRGPASTAAGDAQAVLTALAVLVQRRSEQAWEAVGQRLAAGLWDVERDLRPTAARLLARTLG